MVSLKTPEVPKPMSRADFVSIEAYVLYLEQQIEFTKMKEEMAKMKRDMGKRAPEEDEVTMEDLGPDEEADVGGGEGEEEEEEEEEVEVEREEGGIRFIKGYSTARNPGKLIVGEKQRFVCGSSRNFEGGIKNYYNCAHKHENKGRKEDMCKVSVLIQTDKDGENPNMSKAPILSEHNHVVDESLVVKWDIMADMETMMLGDVSLLPNVVMKRVILKYQQKHRANPDLWMQVQSILPPDESMCKRLRNVRMKSFGRLPQSREELDLKNLLENLKEWGGENVVILDSNKMWEEEDFRAEFCEDEMFADGETPKRTILFTTPMLLRQLAGSSKWSQVLIVLLLGCICLKTNLAYVPKIT